MDMEEIISFDALYESMHKCKRHVMWKGSVAHFVLNGVEETYKLSRELKDGTYKARKVIKNRIGYTGPGKYYLPQWTVKDIEEISKLMFDDFSADDFHRYCEELAIFSHGSIDMKKANSSFSDGMKMKLMLAGVMARKTDLLLLDEPASPLDPLMRDKLCQMIGEYIHEGNGKRSVFFSTHNISDMENITDYAIIMENGQIVEQGFVEDLKEKYILIKGDAADTEAAGKVLYSMTKNPYGFEGICLAENIDKLAGLNVTKEIPTLYQISVAVMKNNTKIVMR